MFLATQIAFRSHLLPNFWVNNRLCLLSLKKHLNMFNIPGSPSASVNMKNSMPHTQMGLKVSKAHIRLSVSLCQTSIDQDQLLATSPALSRPACCHTSHHDENGLTSETVNKPSITCFLFIRMVLAMVSLQINKAVTKTEAGARMGYCSGRTDHSAFWWKVDL